MVPATLVIHRRMRDPFSLVRTRWSLTTHQSIDGDISTEILESLWLCIV